MSQPAIAEDLNLARFVDKMVTLTAWTDDDDLASKGTVLEQEGDRVLVDLSGRVIAMNPNGEALLFKPRSQRTTHMLDAGDVTKIDLAGSATLRPVGQKSLRPLTVQNARRHLADFHGFARTKLNDMSDELALQVHDEINHEDLGHNHNLAEGGANSKASPSTAATRASILAEIDAA